MIKLKNEIFEDVDFIKVMTLVNTYEKLPPGQAYRFFLLMQEINGKSEAFIAVKSKLLNKYGTKSEEAGTWTVPKENLGALTDEMNELKAEEFKLNWNKIPFPVDLQLSPSQMVIADYFFDLSVLKG